MDVVVVARETSMIPCPRRNKKDRPLPRLAPLPMRLESLKASVAAGTATAASRPGQPARSSAGKPCGRRARSCNRYLGHQACGHHRHRRQRRVTTCNDVFSVVPSCTAGPTPGLHRTGPGQPAGLCEQLHLGSSDHRRCVRRSFRRDRGAGGVGLTWRAAQPFRAGLRRRRHDPSTKAHR
jgi:hypothetical protein